MKSISSKAVRNIGILLILLGLAIALVQYFPVMRAEFNYQIKRLVQTQEQEVVLSPAEKDPKTDETSKKFIIPEDKDFGLVIPKIGVNISVIPRVSPFDSKEYQKVLTRGVAHVKDTAFPNEQGNTVIFAHSSDNFYNANRYNAIFYLLNKMEMGDEVFLTYENRLYKMEVTEKSIVAEESISYMEGSNTSKLTLITCWPPGTTIKRLVVVAEPAASE